MNNYELWLCDQQGYRLKNLTHFTRLEYGRKLNQVSFCKINTNDLSFWGLLQKDLRLLILKSVDGGTPFLAGDCCWFTRAWQRTFNDGVMSMELTAASPNYLIKGREILYAADTTQTKKTNIAPNVLLTDIIRENMGSSAISGRNLSSYITIGSPSPIGTVINKSCAWKELEGTFEEICATATANGIPLFYDITYNYNTRLFSFEIFQHQRGTDRGLTSSTPVIFSTEMGNINNVVEGIDYIDEITAVAALGKGEGVNRATYELTNSTEIAASMFGRRERTINSNADTPDQLQDEAKAALETGKAKFTFTADLLDVGTKFDKHYFWGDKVVVVNFDKQPFDCYIDGYTMTIENGKESLKTITRIVQ